MTKVSRVELGLLTLLVALLLLGPAAHSWFEYRLNRDVAQSQADILRRLSAVEAFTAQRGETTPGDVLDELRELEDWLKVHVECPCGGATPPP